MREIGHFIDGKQVSGTSGRTGDVFNPNTGEVQAKVALASKAEVEKAIANAQAAFPALCEGRRPSIVLFSSVAAQDGLPGQAGYAAAKAGVLGLARALAAEWAGAGIRVNAVVPGLVATPKVLGLPGPARDRLLAGVPMRRVAALAEVVGPVLYLLSPAAGYMTGQALRLDGGAGLGQAGLYR